MSQSEISFAAELRAAKVVAALVEEHPISDRVAVAHSLLAWVMRLARGADPETRFELAKVLFVRACWLSPHDNFDQEAVRIVREEWKAWDWLNDSARPASGSNGITEREAGDPFESQ